MDRDRREEHRGPTAGAEELAEELITSSVTHTHSGGERV